MGSPTVPIYRTTGHLVDSISREHVAEAQKYLQADEMAKYLDPPLEDVVTRLTWYLDSNGYDYYVEAICNRELTTEELKQLGSEVSGQNSDGLGEGFEQQEFAWSEDPVEDEDCSACDGTGTDDAGMQCGECDGQGVIDGEEGGHMCSFDWETNDSVFVRVN